jgi:hypothetical protein
MNTYTSVIRLLHKLGVLLAATAIIASCQKKIEKKPGYQLEGSSPLTTIKEAENVLTGAYNGFQSTSYYRSGGSGAYSIMPDIMGDDLIESRESLGNYRKLAEWTYESNEPNINATWLNAYNIISTVNIVLRDIDKIAPEDPLAANRIKGQALAIRAHVHFDLLRGFGESLDYNATAKGVAYVTKYDVKAKPARITVKESYDKILADLAAAETSFLGGLDHDINTEEDRSHIDLLAVKGMQARVLLYAGKWQAAAEAATAVINERPLSDIGAFPSIWNDESQEEVLWAVSFANLSDGAVYDNVFFVRGNRSAYKPASQFVTMYNQVNDIRYSTYFATIGSLNGTVKTPRLVVAKHIGKGTAKDGVVNWKAYRTGEMYLVRAEANYQQGKEAEALDDLNNLRAHRINGFVPGTETGQVLWTAITAERRKELAFEGHRFFDLKRWNKTAISRCASNTDTPSNICALASNNRAWAWPIPFNETLVNPGIGQNSNY